MSLNVRDIQITIRNMLIVDSTLQNLLGVDSNEVKKRIRIGHITNNTGIRFPCITFFITNGGVQDNQFSYLSRLHIDVWTKTNLDDAHNIYERIKKLINLVPYTGGGIARVIEKNYEDNLYEVQTRTYHISS